ncbi:MAG: efflux transporter outer membrane subunit [Dokdonella sp.]|nr:efflux transporter outer membrane subunit [Dokdonella sp.]MCW5567618.1 efflux transporter outer membrane subunit [Dokdonella sp.]
MEPARKPNLGASPTSTRKSFHPDPHFVALALALLLAGCAVGPDFRAPAAPATDTIIALPAETVAADVPTGDAQRFLAGRPVPAQWWRFFANAELDRRVERALAHSPTVASAQAALRQAQEGVNAARGPLLPSLDAGIGATRQNGLAAGQPGASPFTVHHASASVGYTLDLFGGVRRGIEAQSALADLAAYQLEGTYLSLAANVATTSFLEASLREQIAATAEIVEVYRRQYDLVARQNEIGAKSQADVLLAQSQVATASAQLPALRKALAQTQTQLAVYVGALPSEAEFAALDLDEISLPQDIPLSLPSTLVRERPDIRIAEAQLHQASAQVGIATANLFPTITLSGSYGSQAARSGDLFGSGSEAWSLGLNLLQPVFRGGSLRAQKRAAEAGLERAAADYRTTVLTAFQNVADSLRALELDAEGLRAQAAAVEATAASLALVDVQFREGAASQLQVLDATRQYQQARIALIQARAARLTDTAALYAALGGGWRGDPNSTTATVVDTASN